MRPLYALALLVVAGSAAAQTEPQYDAVFDDFEYLTAPSSAPVPGTSTVTDRNLFGQNTWITGLGSSDSETARAWRRFNWDDNETYGTYEIPLHGSEVTIRVTPLTSGGRGEVPGITSSFLLGDGTYAARVKLSALPAPERDLKGVSAFWLYSQGTVRVGQGPTSTYWGSEVDFEWNTWDNHSTAPFETMSYGNIRGSSSTERTVDLRLDCGAWSGSASMNYAGAACRTGSWPSIPTEDPRILRASITDKWLLLVFTVERGVRTSFYLVSDGPPYSVWGGSDNPDDDYDHFPLAGRPAIVTDHAPVHEMGPVFSFHNLPTTLAHDVYLTVDYFYHTAHVFLKPDLTLDLTTLRDEINRTRVYYRPVANASNLGLRVNTMGVDLDLARTPSMTPLAPAIQGPPLSTVLVPGQEYTWLLVPSRNGAMQQATVWQYRTRSATTHQWSTTYTPATEDEVSIVWSSNWEAIQWQASTANDTPQAPSSPCTSRVWWASGSQQNGSPCLTGSPGPLGRRAATALE